MHKTVENLLKIYQGQEIDFLIDKRDPVKVKKITFYITKSKSIISTRDEEKNIFLTKKIEKNLIKNFIYQLIKAKNSDNEVNSMSALFMLDYLKKYGVEL